jgi:RecA/RadA recombinase
MNPLQRKAQILESLKIPSLVKIDDKNYIMKINSKWDLNISLVRNSDMWEAKSEGKSYMWKKALEVPADVKDIIQTVVEPYNDALMDAAEENVSEPEKGPLDNLKDAGFEIPEEAMIVDQPKEPQISEEEKARLEREENERKLAAMEAYNTAKDNMSKVSSAPEQKKPEPKGAEISYSSTSKTPILDLIDSYVGNDVLEIFGDTGSGKTAFVKQVASEAAKAGKKVFYLDTERNLTKKDIELLKKCKYQYTPVIEEIDRIVQKLPEADVVILDSVGFPVLTTFARMNTKQKGDALLKLIAIFGSLKEWAYHNNGVVLVTNQPESEFGKDKGTVLNPFGDKSQFAAKEIWKVIKNDSKPGLTSSSIQAFRSRSVGRGTPIAQMKITNVGVEVVQ